MDYYIITYIWITGGFLTLCLWILSEILIRHLRLKIFCVFEISGTIIPTIMISFVIIIFFPAFLLFLPIRFLKILDKIYKLF
ncbi:MAG: hypothetical protein UT09_C0027G0006 [Parcubacteria group bacterium GW2011_GWF2_38_8]|nr:MAG: hypothetical protein UT09_C0027G0006 [Parcubacteria group bacterium GW2011_GWF2_38_8]